MFKNTPLQLVDRLQATSYALRLTDHLQEIADEVYDLDASGASERDINRRIRAWMKQEELDHDSWLAEVEPELERLGLAGVFDLNKLWKGYGVEPWFEECIRSVAFTGEPIPFLPFAAGLWIEDDVSEPHQLIAIMTPLTDPHLAARQLVQKHRKLFGEVASGSPRKDEVFNARMLARHEPKGGMPGMSYEEIAIQNLREQYPDIVNNKHRYKAELKRERERVAKAVRAARELWKMRGVESSIAE